MQFPKYFLPLFFQVALSLTPAMGSHSSPSTTLYEVASDAGSEPRYIWDSDSKLIEWGDVIRVPKEKAKEPMPFAPALENGISITDQEWREIRTELWRPEVLESVSQEARKARQIIQEMKMLSRVMVARSNPVLERHYQNAFGLLSVLGARAELRSELITGESLASGKSSEKLSFHEAAERFEKARLRLASLVNEGEFFKQVDAVATALEKKTSRKLTSTEERVVLARLLEEATRSSGSMSERILARSPFRVSSERFADQLFALLDLERSPQAIDPELNPKSKAVMEVVNFGLEIDTSSQRGLNAQQTVERLESARKSLLSTVRVASALGFFQDERVQTGFRDLNSVYSFQTLPVELLVPQVLRKMQSQQEEKVQGTRGVAAASNGAKKGIFARMHEWRKRARAAHMRAKLERAQVRRD